jgi:hypothetical protein
MIASLIRFFYLRWPQKFKRPFHNQLTTGMAIAILFVAFISMFLLLGSISTSENWIRDTIIKSSLIFSVILLVITESAGMLHQLNFGFILSSWLVVSILFFFALFLVRDKRKLFIKHIWSSFRAFYTATKGEVAFYVLATLLLLIFIQGIINPPNNWDSMTYHLSRIVAWISQESLTHFQTHITRQVYQPPFAEFVILHVNLLGGSDYFSNSVQFFFLLLCFPILLSLLDEMGIKQYPVWMLAVLLFAIPNVVLQASSTQNDIVVSFFILSATVFAFKSFREGGFSNFLYLGVSVGLAMLTKGTAYIFLAPILFIFGIAILYKTLATKKLVFIHFSLVAALVVMALNAGHFYRNQQLSGNILGTSERENNRYVNQVMDADVMTSNLIKNISLHLGPYPLSRISKRAVLGLHSLLGLNADDPGANWLGEPFLGASDFPSHEDTAANPFHFFLILTALIFIIIAWVKRKARVDRMILLLMFVLVFQMLFFSWYLRWQPWHSRLHTTGFMLSIPLIIYVCQFNDWFKRLVNVFIPIIIVYACFVVLINSSRPYLSYAPVTRDITILDSRDKKFYANKLLLFEEYEAIKNEIAKLEYKNIGLILDREDWEYPLFRDVYTRPIRPVHVMVNNVTSAAPVQVEQVDCIVATTVNDDFMEFKGRRYVNQSPANKYVWLYRKANF